MNYWQSGPIFVWLVRDEEDAWEIDRSCCADADDIVWWSNDEAEVLPTLQDVLADENIAPECDVVLVTCHLWGERIDSIDYGTDYDGGVDVDEITSGYSEPPTIPEPTITVLPKAKGLTSD